MKTTSTFIHRAILTTIAAIGLTLGAMGVASAHNGQWDSHHHYYRDNYGYWDNHDHYRHYEHWHNHTGYWDTRGGTHIFINVE